MIKYSLPKPRTLLADAVLDKPKRITELPEKLIEAIKDGKNDVQIKEAVSFGGCLTVRLKLKRGMSPLRVRMTEIQIDRSLGYRFVINKKAEDNTEISYVQSRPRTGLKPLLESSAQTESNGEPKVCVGASNAGEPVFYGLSRLKNVLIGWDRRTDYFDLLFSMYISLATKYGPQELKIFTVGVQTSPLKALDGSPYLVTERMAKTSEEAINVLGTVKELGKKRREQGKKGTPIIIFADMDGIPDAEEIYFLLAELNCCEMSEVGIYTVIVTPIRYIPKLYGKLDFTAVAYKTESDDASDMILKKSDAARLTSDGDTLWKFPDCTTERIFCPQVGKNEMKRALGVIRAQEFSFDDDKTNAILSGKALKRAEKKRVAELDLKWKALKIMVEEDEASRSLLQRRLNVGNNVIYDIIEELQSYGYIDDDELKIEARQFFELWEKLLLGEEPPKPEE